MDALIQQFGAPVLVSAVVALGAQFVNNSTDSALLQANINATKELSGAVIELKVQMAAMNERVLILKEHK